MNKEKGVYVSKEPTLHLRLPSGSDALELQPEWFPLLKKHCFPSNPTITLNAYKETNLIAELPLIIFEKEGRLNASKIKSLVNYYTSIFSILKGSHFTLNNKKDTLENIELELLKYFKKLKHWDIIELTPLDPNDKFYQSLISGCKQLNLIVESPLLYKNKFLLVSDRSYEEYKTQLPSRLINTIKRKSKQLNNKFHSEIHFFYNKDSSVLELNKAIDDYEKVYENSWKQAEGQPDFIRELCCFAHSQGWLRMSIMYIDKEPVAGQIWLVVNSTASIFKLAYDEKYKSLSVGSILTDYTMRHVIDVDKVQKVDFLIGDDQYKDDWMSHTGMRHALLIYNKKTIKGCILISKLYLKKLIHFIHCLTLKKPLS